MRDQEKIGCSQSGQFNASFIGGPTEVQLVLPLSVCVCMCLFIQSSFCFTISIKCYSFYS